jgi:hypothetical protein
LARDCNVLVPKIFGRIEYWLSKHLSFAGRLQLISSELVSIQSYCTSIFILPKKVIKNLRHKFNGFMWNGGCDGPAKAKVSWNFVCMPKDEGVLGLRMIEDWNRVAVLMFVWLVFTKVGSLIWGLLALWLIW